MTLIDTPVGAVSELIERRTLRSKTFDMGGNKRRFIQPLSGIVHYEESLDVLSSIDTNFVSTSGGYEVTQAPYDLLVPNNTLGFNYVSKAGGDAQVRLIGLNDASIPSPTIQPQVSGNLILLEAVVPGLDIIIKARSAKVEIWKIIKNAAAPHIFNWEIIEDKQSNIIIGKTTAGTDNFNLVDRGGNEGTTRRPLQINNVSTEDDPISNPGKNTFEIRELATGATVLRGRGRVPKLRPNNETIYPLEIDQDITESIVDNNDDGSEAQANWYSVYNGRWYFGELTGTNQAISGGLGWRTLPIPVGVTIDSAVIKAQCDASSGTVTGDIFGDAVDDAPLPWGASDRPSQITQTTASTAVTVASTGAKTFTVTGIVDEIAGRTGWASNNDMRFAFVPDDLAGTGIQCAFYDYNQGPTNSATLEVDYTVAGGQPKIGKNHPSRNAILRM